MPHVYVSIREYILMRRPTKAIKVASSLPVLHTFKYLQRLHTAEALCTHKSLPWALNNTSSLHQHQRIAIGEKPAGTDVLISFRCPHHTAEHYLKDPVCYLLINSCLLYFLCDVEVSQDNQHHPAQELLDCSIPPWFCITSCPGFTRW